MALGRIDALTLRANGRLPLLVTDCSICPAFDPNTVPASGHPKHEKFKAIWDTGASATLITQEVVDKCGLKPTGMKKVHTANGVYDAETFVVNVLLPNNVQIANVSVTRGNLSPQIQTLIGMDIITLGDFSITNAGGNTVMSFRTPSIAEVDFVQDLNQMPKARNPKFQPGPPGGKRRRK